MRPVARAAERRELRVWYAEGLRPKVVRAARSGAIRGAQAAELERQMTALLGPVPSGRRASAGER